MILMSLKVSCISSVYFMEHHLPVPRQIKDVKCEQNRSQAGTHYSMSTDTTFNEHFV